MSHSSDVHVLPTLEDVLMATPCRELQVVEPYLSVGQFPVFGQEVWQQLTGVSKLKLYLNCEAGVELLFPYPFLFLTEKKCLRSGVQWKKKKSLHISNKTKTDTFIIA